MTMGGAGLGLAQKLMTTIRADRSETADAPTVPPNGKVDSIKA